MKRRKQQNSSLHALWSSSQSPQHLVGTAAGESAALLQIESLSEQITSIIRVFVGLRSAAAVSHVCVYSLCGRTHLDDLVLDQHRVAAAAHT